LKHKFCSDNPDHCNYFSGYDVKTLGETLDWVAVMTYDFHGQWDKKTGHVAPLYFHPDDDFFFFNAVSSSDLVYLLKVCFKNV
jgi:GH18 family chitinase